MPRNTTSGIKLALIVAIASALVFVFFGGITHGYTWPNIALLAAAGAVIGAIAAPTIEPRAFTHPTLWQVFFSVCGCVLLAAFLRAGADGYALAVVAGIIIGYLAPYWIKHIQVP